MSTLAFYSREMETERRKLVDELMKGVQPAAFMRFPEGVAAVAAHVNLSPFEKIRQVHDRFLFIAAGDYHAINEAFFALLNTATNVEMALSPRDLRLNVLMDHPDSFAHQMARVFQAGNLRPLAVKFALYSLADMPPLCVIVAPTGELEYVESIGMVGCRDKPPTVAAESEAEAVCMLKKFVGTQALKEVRRFEIGVLRTEEADMVFDHRWEDAP